MSKKKRKYIKCPHCDRYDFLSVYRKRTLVEFRNININATIGEMPYKGNWKKEKDIAATELSLRCSACENAIDLSKDKIKGIEEVKISNKGVLFVSDGLTKFFDVGDK